MQQVEDDAKASGRCIFDALVDEHQANLDLKQLVFKDTKKNEKSISLYKSLKQMIFKKRKN